MSPFNDKAIGRRVKRLREYLGYKNATQFAEFLGINVSRVRNLEAGRQLMMPLAQLMKRRLPGLSLDWLFYGDPTLGPSLKPLNYGRDYQRARDKPVPEARSRRMRCDKCRAPIWVAWSSPPADQRLCMQCGLAQLKADPDAAIGAPTEAQMVDIAAALGRAKQ